MPTDQRLFFRLNVAQHHLRKLTDRLLMDRVGVSSAQVGAMFLIRQHAGCSQSEIARELAQDESAVTTMLRRLEQGGMVERRQDPDDRRARKVFLTKEGETKLDRVAAMLGAFNETLTEGFSDEEVEVLARFLTRLPQLREQDFDL